MSKISEMTRESWIESTFPEWGTWLVEDIENEVVAPGNVAMWWLGCTGVWFKTPADTNITIDLWCGNGKRTHGDRKMKVGHQMANMCGGRAMQPNLRNVPFVIDPFAFKKVDAVLATHYHQDHMSPEWAAHVINSGMTTTDENGKTWYFAKYDDIVLNNKSNYGAPKKGIASSPIIDVTYFYDDVDLAPTVAQQARFVDDKGQEIAPIKVNMVRRDIDLAYYAYFPTAPETIQANGKTYKLQSTDDQEIKSHKIRISNTVTITYIYKEVTEGTAEKPVTPVTPTSAKKLRLPKGNNGVKTRIPVNYKHQTNSSNQGTTKLPLPKGNNGVKTRVPAKKNTPILAVDYL